LGYEEATRAMAHYHPYLAVVAPETGPALAQGGECAGLGPKK